MCNGKFTFEWSLLVISSMVNDLFTIDKALVFNFGQILLLGHQFGSVSTFKYYSIYMFSNEPQLICIREHVSL